MHLHRWSIVKKIAIYQCKTCTRAVNVKHEVLSETYTCLHCKTSTELDLDMGPEQVTSYSETATAFDSTWEKLFFLIVVLNLPLDKFCWRFLWLLITLALFITETDFHSSKMGQGNLLPRRLRPQCGSISHPLWFQSRLDTQWESPRFFINLAISPTVAVSISAGYKSGFPHILILSVVKKTDLLTHYCHS